MSRHQIKRWRDILFNETGQMSIFVALIFQVLFVFFAMVINIGLLIHDKINLQNAVDLGAYYAAARQADLLNEIAHINYQIRQDYKLLTWRYRVLGTLGRQGTSAPNDMTLPPARRSPGSPQPDAPRPDFFGTQPEEYPVVCVSNDLWSEMLINNSLENYCYRQYGTSTPGIPSVSIIAPWVPGISGVANWTSQAQQQLTLSCQNAGPLNWAFTVQMLYAYRQAVSVRKDMIKSLRRNLVLHDFKDRQNQSVFDGAKQTIFKNLTKANQESLDVEFINGLEMGSCAQNDGEVWLPQILTAPALLYQFTSSGGGASGCNYNFRFHNDVAGLPVNGMNTWDPSGILRSMTSGEPSDPNHPLHSSMGFEKNPWCMAYVGVKAKTKPRKPFAPFGSPIELTARSFAQPFGGRIGPWYYDRWPNSSPRSDGGNRLDPLTSPRRIAGGPPISAYSGDNLPNYSRYPGDQVGMKSQLAQAGFRHIFNPYASLPLAQRISLTYFSTFGDIPQTGDPLAWKQGTPPNSPPPPGVQLIRQAEIAAVAPDLFDATYYSIDPEYPANYFNAGPPTRFTLQPILGNQPIPISDIGSRLGSLPNMRNFAVINQIQTAAPPSGSPPNQAGLDPGTLPLLYWVIRDWKHLLTGWAPHRAGDYQTFPSERFAACATPATNSLMIPGKCAVGGRTGYSVRLVSKDHLLSKWNVGGAGEAPGDLLNKPPTDF